MTLVVVSPHLDDAVFSCGTLIHAAAAFGPVEVVTVCAGVPEPGFVTQLDQAAGFSSSREAVLTRRAEDLEALAILGAEAVHLDVLDGQYDRDDPLDRRGTIRAAVLDVATDRIDAQRLASAPRFVVPVGIRHADHGLVAAACAGLTGWRYEELPYRVLWPDAIPAAAELGDPAIVLPSCDAKAQAIRCYRSQLGDGPPGRELAADERYHRGTGTPR